MSTGDFKISITYIEYSELHLWTIRGSGENIF